MVEATNQFLTATTYDEIETVTDALVAGEVEEVRILSDLLSTGYLSSLGMAITDELLKNFIEKLNEEEMTLFRNSPGSKSGVTTKEAGEYTVLGVTRPYL